MLKIGRNDPCPCGSGKKYKRCCLKKDDEESLRVSKYRNALSMLTDRLTEFSFLSRFRDEFEEAMKIYYCLESFEDLLLPEDNIPNSMSWFIFDYELSDGDTVISHFIKERLNSLNPLERELAYLLKDSYVSVFEVQDIKPGYGLTLVDIFTDQKLFVNERMGSERTTRWAILAARIISLNGLNLIASGGLMFPPQLKQSLLDYIWTNYVEETERKISIAQFLKGNAELINWFVMDMIEEAERRPLPEMVTTDGDRLVFAKSIFKVQDFERAKERIKRIDGFDISGEDSEERLEIDWHVDNKSPFREVIYGDIVLTRDRLTLECKSRERLELGKEILLRNLGDSIAHKIDTFQDVESALKDYRERQGSKEVREEIPKEIQDKFLQEYLEDYYDRWIDMEIPALDNKTPREAARDPNLKGRLIQLLKEMDFAEGAMKRDGRYGYDFDKIRRKLGLSIDHKTSNHEHQNPNKS